MWSTPQVREALEMKDRVRPQRNQMLGRERVVGLEDFLHRMSPSNHYRLDWCFNKLSGKEQLNVSVKPLHEPLQVGWCFKLLSGKERLKMRSYYVWKCTGTNHVSIAELVFL